MFIISEETQLVCAEYWENDPDCMMPYLKYGIVEKGEWKETVRMYFTIWNPEIW